MRAYHDLRCFAEPPPGVDAPGLKKPALLHDALTASGMDVEWQAVTPIEWAEVERVHDPNYVRSVRTGDPHDLVAGPWGFWSEELAESLLWETGSMVSASLGVLESGGAAASFSSGFHHAHYHEPGTFCLINGLVLAALRVIDAGLDAPVLILDCDYHYGNGTDNIIGRFHDQPDVRIAHRSLGRRFKKPYQAPEYMAAMKDVTKRIRQGRYGLVIYQAGMDVLRGDPLGGLLTFRETYERDRMVFEACHAASIPVAWNLAGGYSTDEAGTLGPTVTGHLNTFIACATVHGESAPAPTFPDRR